jgi:hypothetical protein
MRAGKAGSESGLEAARAMQALKRRDWVRVLAAQAEARSTGRRSLAFLSGAPVPVGSGTVPGRTTAVLRVGDKLYCALLDVAAVGVWLAVRALKGDGGREGRPCALVVRVQGICAFPPHRFFPVSGVLVPMHAIPDWG